MNPASSILNINVSCVANYYSKDNPKPVNLLAWLTSPKYAPQIAHLRTIADKDMRNKLKARLPAITPSGLFSSINQQGLLQHSRFIQFDIDLKENLHIANYKALKAQLCRISNLAYCGLSASGQGFWGLLHIAYPERHLQHWQHMSHSLRQMGINIDAAPKNICSLRGYSYDADAHINHHAPALYQFAEPPAPAPHTLPGGATANQHTIRRIIATLAAQQRDVTGGYITWFAIGCCIAANFGEDGCSLYHDISQFHPKYEYDDTNRKYKECLKHSSDAGIGVLVNLCKAA